MSWASRRRTKYLTAVILFFIVVVGGPIAYTILSIEPTCFDGKQNQGETVPDKSGPCSILDERYITPYAVMWARSFEVRSGSYTAVAYIGNPNPEAGVALAHYRFGLYDSQNILIAERVGATFIMPGGITPVLEGGIDPAGNAFAASGTALPDLAPDGSTEIAFNWPLPFVASVGRIDIIPLLRPEEAPLSAQ